MELLKLKPIYQPRVWGGSRLLPESLEPVGEAWVVYEGCVVDGGSWDGSTLADVAAREGELLLGNSVVQKIGARFPLLVKLLHSTEWLSVQVHPNDEQAERLEGPGHFGKTEAWHFIEAEPDAGVVFGLKGGPLANVSWPSLTSGELESVLNIMPVTAGDTLFMPAGCVHAIGPGLLTYEVQQTSDITYRLFDWNRPASDGRDLHLEKGLSVIGDCGDLSAGRIDPTIDGVTMLVGCDYFALRMVRNSAGAFALDTGRQSFHAVTVTEGGSIDLCSDAGCVTLEQLDTALVPASAGEYSLESEAPFAALVSSVP